MFPELVIWLAYLALILGVIALVLEALVFPGFGVAGIVGIILVGWGVLLLAVDITQATVALVVALIATIVIFIVGLQLMSRLKLWNRLALQNKQDNKEGYVLKTGNEPFCGQGRYCVHPAASGRHGRSGRATVGRGH